MTASSLLLYICAFSKGGETIAGSELNRINRRRCVHGSRVAGGSAGDITPQVAKVKLDPICRRHCSRSSANLNEIFNGHYPSTPRAGTPLSERESGLRRHDKPESIQFLSFNKYRNVTEHPAETSPSPENPRCPHPPKFETMACETTKARP